MPNLQIVRLTDTDRALIEPAWLARAEAVHRELRPQIEADYAAQMRGIFADGGEMIAAVDGDAVLGVAVFRVFRDTFSGRRLYVDDLVTTASRRSQGAGKLMLDWLKQEARRREANSLFLDSGTQRTDAHRFYFREGLVVTAFNFKQSM